MPDIKIPGLGVSVKWTRHNILTVTTSANFGFPPLILRLARSALTNADLGDLALHCLRNLPRLWSPNQSKVWVTTRGKTAQLRILWGDWPVKIAVTYADLKALRRAWKDPEYRQRLFDYLHLGVLFSTAICATPSAAGGRLARGRNPMARLLTAYLSSAFFFAYQLLRSLSGDTKNLSAGSSRSEAVARLKGRVRDIMLEDEAKDYLSRFELGDGSPLLSEGDLTNLDSRITSMVFPTIAYLVDRAFRGAWEGCGVARPTHSGSPWNYMRQYVYGLKSYGHTSSLVTTALIVDPRLSMAYVQWWINLLLGPSGSAAHAFRLLPPHKK